MDRPAPKAVNPAMVTAGTGVASASAMPAVAITPLALITVTTPKRWMSRSPTARPTVMVTEKAAKPKAARPALVPRLSRR